MSNDELLVKVESLKNVLVTAVTGGARDESRYVHLRSELWNNDKIKSMLPRFVHSCRSINEFWGLIQPKFGTYAGRREYIRTEFDPLLSFLEGSALFPGDDIVTDRLEQIDSEYVTENWSKALERRSSDPEGAITIARTLLETVCKHILDEEGIPYEERWDMPKLYGAVAKVLNLSPSDQTEDVFKQILGGCKSVVDGLGTLRNRLSDSHGRTSTPRPSARHAQLAVNLAGAMAAFLMDSWSEMRERLQPTKVDRV